MLKTRVIPCLDVRDGRVVKGVRFQGLRDSGDPTELAASYEAQGADEIVVLDVSATDAGRLAALDTVRSVRASLSIPLTVGGGVRALEDAGRLLEAGADRVSVNTAAFEDPELMERIADRFGAQCAVLALDATADGAHGCASGFQVVTRSGSRRTGVDAVAWAREATWRGAGEVLLTSYDRDGTRAGYDLPLIRAIRRGVDVPIVASGGASSPAHMMAAVEAGADAVLAASIFHEGEWTVWRLKRRLRSAGLEVRR